MYTPARTFCLCYPASLSLIDYARVFQSIIDETREDLLKGRRYEANGCSLGKPDIKEKKGEENDLFCSPSVTSKNKNIKISR